MEELLLVAPSERQSPRQHKKASHSEGPDVTFVCINSSKAFRGKKYRSSISASVALVLSTNLSHPEVNNFDRFAVFPLGTLGK